MQKWEFCTVIEVYKNSLPRTHYLLYPNGQTVDIEGDHAQEEIGELGLQGWEMVNVVHERYKTTEKEREIDNNTIYYYFKRPVE